MRTRERGRRTLLRGLRRTARCRSSCARSGRSCRCCSPISSARRAGRRSSIPRMSGHCCARYYADLRAELEHFGGTVEKFIGDAVVALFGAPACARGRSGARRARGARDPGARRSRERGGSRPGSPRAGRRLHRRGADRGRRPDERRRGDRRRRRDEHRRTPAGGGSGGRRPRRRGDVPRDRPCDRLPGASRRCAAKGKAEPVTVHEAVEPRCALRGGSRRRRPSPARRAGGGARA